MSEAIRASATPRDLPWHIVSRWQEFIGESRANLLRIIAVGLFYLVELVIRQDQWLAVWGVTGTGITESAHRSITVICAAWIIMAVGVLMLLRNRMFPAWLKYASTGCDLLFLTLVLIVGTGPSSPMVAGYFVIIALAGLRFSVRLVQCATVGATISYLWVNGYIRWIISAESGVPRYHQIQTLLAILIVGVIVGQIVRQVRLMAAEYRDRSATPRIPS